MVTNKHKCFLIDCFTVIASEQAKKPDVQVEHADDMLIIKGE